MSTYEFLKSRNARKNDEISESQNEEFDIPENENCEKNIENSNKMEIENFPKKIEDDGEVKEYVFEMEEVSIEIGAEECSEMD